MLDIDLVEPNRDQPRKQFDEAALAELAESVRSYGVLQPILVQQEKDYYRIIAGERRWRAARLAGLKQVPVIIKNLSEGEIVEIALIENIQRENLNPIEEAQAYQKLMNDFSLKQDEIARRVSKSRSAVTNSMRLLKLDAAVQEMLIDGSLTSGHARALLSLESKDLQVQIAALILQRKLSVRETEALVKEALTEKKPKKAAAKRDTSMDAFYEDIADRMKQVLGTKVSVKNQNNKKGKIEIEYYSQDDLNRILELIQSIALG